MGAVAGRPRRSDLADVVARVLVALSLGKLLAGLGALLVAHEPRDLQLVAAYPPSPLLSVLSILAFGYAASLLIVGNPRSTRAWFLGATFFLTATSFSNRLLEELAAVSPRASTAASLLAGFNLDALMPFAFWSFIGRFPDAPERLRGAVRSGTATTAIIGGLLVLGNVGLAFEQHLGILPFPFTIPANALRSGCVPCLAPGMYVLTRAAYYPLLLVLAMSALPVALVNARVARPVERRRVRFFLGSLAAGSIFIALEILAEELVPAYGRMVSDPSIQVIHAAIVYLILFSVPVATAFSVLVHPVQGLRLTVRQAVQYGLARYMVLVATAVPFVGLVWYLWTNRQTPILQLFAGWQAFSLLFAVALGLAALLLRKPLLETIDRQFFRDQFDSRIILSRLIEQIRLVNTRSDLAALLVEEIDRALHVDHVSVLLRHPQSRRFVPLGHGAPLSVSATLTTLLAGAPDPLEVHSSLHNSALERLPADERQWLSDGQYRLLVPMLGGRGAFVGLMALGPKKSELPYDQEDRRLLSSVAAAAALLIENRSLTAPTSGPRGEPTQEDEEWTTASLPPDAAMECISCLSLHAPGTERCPRCHHQLAIGTVPHVLAGKFRLVQRLGSGGMGVVYLATDFTLRRSVAIKTLPRLSPQSVALLRREARLVASIAHPQIAQIYGMETWNDTPMLVFEYLEGGTLRERIAQAPLSINETVRLGLTLAEVLERAHARGVIHGDIKPGNIAYDINGTPKILDFGVARLMHRSLVRTGAAPETTTRLDSSDSEQLIETLARVGHLAGTLPYLAPEVLQGEPPSPMFDLWSLGIVMYEALTARNPVAGGSSIDTLVMIREGTIPPVTSSRPDCSPSLDLFLQRALERDRRRRPASAREFREMLADVSGQSARLA